jgi:ATP-dependent Lhr-like helicase
MPHDADGLDVLLPVVASWFRSTFGAPTPPQRLGWPAIASGANTLIFAPTGSGKTLAAFLACLDHLWRVPRTSRGSRILYVSPLKALNQDIYRNLQLPLEGILDASKQDGSKLEPLTVAVRSGDTPQSERQKLIRKPPDILITTPESLHLMLTSRARDTLRSLSHVIVDEIHAVCPNKRGVFLSLLLERLQALNPQGFVRIGLSATQRPLEEVARYLGGRRKDPQSGRWEPRPVQIIDAGQRKALDLEVALPFDRPGPYAGGTVWPAIEQRILGLLQSHRSTIVFVNNRRVAERLTARLNEAAAPADENGPMLARAHHGSLSLDERRETEETLKQGALPAVVATASLELGIDMGAVDLVCQVESPGSVSRGLQRVGRAGHLVGRVSKGRIIAKTGSDLLEAAALCRAMVAGEVEMLRVPTNCLDVLAQQVVACVAIDRWDVAALFDLVRGAYAYRDLTPAAFESVLKLVSGRFPAEMFRDLRARVSWDRVHNRLEALPGSAKLALTSGGTIPDTGQYPVYLGEEGPRLGELDEEFVYERRVGETFVLGTSTWRIETIDPHRVIVSRAEGEPAMAPFWHGEQAARTSELGAAVGLLSRQIAERLDAADVVEWLRAECRLDEPAARSLSELVRRQFRASGAVPDDRTVVVETFRDQSGEMGLAILTPSGGKLHQALKIALQARLRERLGIAVSCLHDDDGVLIRLPQNDEPPLDVFDGLTGERAEELIRSGLSDTALFGLRFRQNAGRALLMPRPDPAKRTPLWLQRLRAKDLLQVARKFPDFPIVIETYRECLHDDLDLPGLRRFLEGIASGSIRVVTRQGELPSPFTSELIFRFTAEYMYEWDEPRRADRASSAPELAEELLNPLLEPDSFARWLDPTAVGRVENRLRGVGQPPRSPAEMAEVLRTLGDMAPSELSGPMPAFLTALEAEQRAAVIELAGAAEPVRWILAEETGLYGRAFADGSVDDDALARIVKRFLRTHALVGLEELTARYPIGPARATELLERWADDGGLVRVDVTGPGGGPRWGDPRNLDEVRRLAIAVRRSESVAVLPEAFAEFVARRQRVHPATRREGAAAAALVLEQLQGFAAPADLWEADLLPRRVRDYRPSWLDELLATGDWSWRAHGEARGAPLVAFTARGFQGAWPETAEALEVTDPESRVLDALVRRGASFATDLARESGLDPSRCRAALEQLLRSGRATNDRFDPLRPGSRAMAEALAEASAGAVGRRASVGRRRASARRPSSARPEGRWSRLENPDQDGEAAHLAWAAVLLDRYGVLTREMAALDPWAPPWRHLAPWLARAELRGDLRRGYFVEGLSGVQYATAEAAEELARTAANRRTSDEPILLCSLDPANLYGSGAPFDVPLLEGGTARLIRSAANYVVFNAGRPVLIVEAYGKRLTGLGSASESELRAAVGLLTTLAGPSRRVLKVEAYNNAATLASPAASWLAEIGFVRDHPGMTYYAGW